MYKQNGMDGRAVLLDIAVRIAVEVGSYRALTISDVARRADVSRSTVVHYFGGADELRNAVFREGVLKNNAAIIQMAKLCGDINGELPA